jgi:hypothetical protein
MGPQLPLKEIIVMHGREAAIHPCLHSLAGGAGGRSTKQVCVAVSCPPGKKDLSQTTAAQTDADHATQGQMTN